MGGRAGGPLGGERSRKRGPPKLRFEMGRARARIGALGSPSTLPLGLTSRQGEAADHAEGEGLPGPAPGARAAHEVAAGLASSVAGRTRTAQEVQALIRMRSGESKLACMSWAAAPALQPEAILELFDGQIAVAAVDYGFVARLFLAVCARWPSLIGRICSNSEAD